MSDSVPFGKYKGRPVEDMLADQDYMNWLAGQPWFRERFGHLTARRDDKPSRTPVHNRLQAMFLDSDYCIAFAKVCDSRFNDMMSKRRLQRERDILACSTKANDLSTSIRNYDAMVELSGDELVSSDGAFLHSYRNGMPFDGDYYRSEKTHADKVALVRRHLDSLTIKLVGERDHWNEGRAQIENRGIDVSATAKFEHKSERGIVDVFAVVELSSPQVYKDEVDEGSVWAEYAIEIKPNVADDYPEVLRQMGRSNSFYLFTERYDGEGVTKDQFVAIFKASDKIVVFKSDVDAAMEAPIA